MKKYLAIIGVFLVLVILIILGGFKAYKNSLKAVSNNKEKIEFVVKTGSNYYTIVDDLYESKLIKSKLGYKIYLKLNAPKNGLEAGTYYLSQNMDVKEILDVLGKGGLSGYENTFTITFNEGLNMRKMAKIISENTNYTEDDVYSLLINEEYLNSLIENYWFIDDTIKNNEIYYSLEGYLFPNTYQFKNDATLEDIFKTLLDETEKVLSEYSTELENSNYSVHEILTLASIIELEGKTLDDRKGISGVFMNRLNSNMSLGSDVTTYYAAKVDMSERDLYLTEINEYNAYNTRHSMMAGKLPVGPICNPSKTSIEAALMPTENDYYYFVSDKTGAIYFARNYNEHLTVINELKDKGLWLVY